MMKRAALVTSAIVVGACAGAGNGESTDGATGSGGASSGTSVSSGAGAGTSGTSSTTGSSTGTSTSSGTGSGGGACGADTAVCTAWNKRATCAMNGSSLVWTEETCAAGSGCVKGACVAGSCSDDCRLGDAGCGLHDAANGADAQTDSTSMHDRARLFEKWIQGDTASYFHHQIVSVKYTDASRTTVKSVYIGDSALHTGLYLAGEAHRLQATGAWQARNNVRDMVDLFDLLFNVAGVPGMLATSIFPAGDQDLRDWTGWNCADFDRHCDVIYNGNHYDYVGEPSRDMYMGPLLGMVAAYDALGVYDETYREIIRKDFVTWANELIKLRTLPLVLNVNGNPLPPQMVSARFFLPEPADMVNGNVQVDVDFNNLGSGRVHGGQDFMPNPSILFRQLPLFSNIPDVPRSDSALMVGGIIRAALHVTEGIPAYANDRAALLDFLLNNNDDWGNGSSWVDVAANWGTHQHDCQASYFGAHIGFIAAYTWGRFEDDPMLSQKLMSSAIDGAVWKDIGTHKNGLFDFGYGIIKGGLAGQTLDEAKNVVEHFPPPPRVRADRSGGCDASPAEIEDRPIYFNTWQENPWLTSDTASSKQTYPGHDYVLAYWMGRSSGILSEDAGDRCLHR